MLVVGQRIQNKQNPHLIATILTVEEGRVTVEWVDQMTGFHGESGYSTEEILTEWESCPPV
jgi:hypothetical protein